MNVLFLLALMLGASFGVGLTLAPELTLAPFGATLTGLAPAATRILGTALLAFAVLLWLARRSDNREFRRGAAYALFVYYLLSSAVLLQIQISGRLNALGWGVVAAHVAFAMAFGCFVVKQ